MKKNKFQFFEKKFDAIVYNMERELRSFYFLDMKVGNNLFIIIIIIIIIIN